MVHKTSGQLGFADAWLGNHPKLNQRLDKLNRLLDWGPFEKLLNVIYASTEGRPSHPVLLLFKALLLQTWYTLSDYSLEEAFDDRLSFRRLTGLSSFEKSPDHSVFSRFRDQWIKHGVHDRLFDELNRQMDVKGLMLRQRTLIDATVIEAAPKKPHANEDGTGGRSPQDPDADWTKKGGKYHFGYKAHVQKNQTG